VSGEIESVVVVGGGTAGWMAALYLRQMLKVRNVAVTLVESPVVGTIGVGEATIPSIVEFVRTLGLDEAEFMRRCSATQKLAIRFDGWRGDGTSYWHAFGPCGGQLNGLDLFHFWAKRRRESGHKLGYADYSLQSALCAAGKAAWSLGARGPIWELGGYAYHLDAAALADYLRELATAAGVRHLYGHVEAVAFDEAGRIASLDIGGGRRLDGDLFLDATGFHGRLIEKELRDPWIDWSHRLLCDSAVAMPLPRDEAFAPYTISSAAPAGWIWRIPLQSRVGTGYVHSRAHVSEDEAAATLIARSGASKRAADPRAVKIRIGRRTRFWVANCVTVGLSSGFVEPLESTGIHLIYKAIKLLVEFWPDKSAAPSGREAYNAEMAAGFDEVGDFIALHYALSARDEPFWREAREAARSPELDRMIALYRDTARVRLPARPVFLEPNYHFVFAGNDCVPRRGPPQVDFAVPREAWNVMDRIRAQNDAFVRAAPSHAQFVAGLTPGRG
jgi:tryptophan halogenase